MKKLFAFYLLASFALWVAPASGASVKFVTESGSGSMDGSAWDNALPGASVQFAIESQSASGGGEVWVAAGTYYPLKDSVGNPAVNSYDCTFSLRANVHLYGGFAGTETEIGQRAKIDKDTNLIVEGWEFANETILSGIIDREGLAAGNAYHVVTDLVAGQKNIIVDGFTIRDGSATDPISPKYYHVLGGGIASKNALISRCIITNNYASLSGGGIAINLQASIDSCFIYENQCEAYGGGVAIIESGTMRNSSVFSNVGLLVGGVVLHAGGNVYSSVISNNSSFMTGGIYMNNGGMLVGSVVSNNEAYFGAGGISSWNGTVISCTSANNVGDGNVGVSGSGYFVNSLFYDWFDLSDTLSSTFIYNALDSSVANSLNEGGHNIPLNVRGADYQNTRVFNNQISFKGNAATTGDLLQLKFQDWSLYSGSSVINAGTPDISGYTLPGKDIYGISRVKYDRIDIGASEFESLLFVSVEGAGAHSGSSWENALSFADIKPTLSFQSGEVWFAAGNYDVDEPLAIYQELKLIGGFAGTESAINERKREDSDGDGEIQPWEFSNETVFINKTVLNSSVLDSLRMLFGSDKTLIDGFTFTSADDVYRGGTLRSNGGKVVNCKIINNKTQFNNFTTLIINALMEDCFISGNQSEYTGAGVSVFEKGEVRNCLITKNKGTYYGGGVFIKDGTLSHCKVLQNEISGYININGAGVNIESGLVDNCLIANNSSKGTSTRAGGIYAYGNTHTVTIRNSTVVHNSVEGEGSTGPDMTVKCAVEMTNCIVGSPLFVQSLNLRNKISYSAIVGGFNDLGAGKNIMNIASQSELDEQFANPSPQLGFFDGDYTYNWQLSPSSKLINRGNKFANGTDASSLDLDSKPRISHDTIDLGAYEYIIPTPKSAAIALSLEEQLTKDSVTFTWNALDVDHYSLWVREGLAGAVHPQTGFVYNTDEKFGSGAYLEGWFCVYEGSDTSVSVTGLMQGSSYKAMLVPNNGYAYRVYSQQAVEDDNILFFTTKREQSINLNMPDTVFAMSRFVANVTSTSGLSVNLSSPSEKDGAITIVGANITANRTDTAIVTAHQSGNTQFFPATVTDTLFVVKVPQTIGFDALANKTYGDADFRPTTLATSQLTVKLTSADTAIAEIINGAIRIKSPGTVEIIADQHGDDIYDSAPSVSQILKINKAPQYVLFGEISDKIYGNEDFSPFVKASSGLEISLTPDNDSVVEIINNATIHIIGTGKVTLTASQDGNEMFAVAPAVSQTFSVQKAAQYISFGVINDKIYGNEDFSPFVKASSGLDVQLQASNDTVVEIINNATIHIIGVGQVTITASQSGNKLFKPVVTLPQQLTVKKAEQNIVFKAISDKTFGSGEFMVDATSSSNLPVFLTSNNLDVAEIVDGKIKINGIGTVKITASQSGNAMFESAPSVVQSFSVSKALQTINLTKFITKTYGDEDFLLDGKSSSLEPITYTSDSPIIEIIGDTVRIKGCGSATIIASQSGTDNISSAKESIVLNISKLQQTIDFKALVNMEYSDTSITPLVSSSAKLKVILSSSDNSVARIINDNVIQIVGAGDAVITASQSGNDTISAAISVIQNLKVSKAIQELLVNNSISKLVFGDNDSELSVSSSADLPVLIQSSNKSIIDVDGSILRIKGVGRVAIRIFQPGTAGIAAVERIDTIEVVRADQTIIDFESHINAMLGDEPLILNASSNTGFAVKYKSMNPQVANLVGNRVKFSSPGICKVVAYIPQSANYEATSDTCIVIVSALDVLEMPEFSYSRDTVIDLNGLRLNNDNFAYSFVSATHNTVKVEGSTATITPKRSASYCTGTDTLWFNANNTSIVGDSLMFAVKLNYTRHADQLGLVTTDSLTGTYNIIAWEPKQKAATDKWIVCRRSQSLSQWENIDTVLATDSSYSVDKKANTRQQAYQYALKTVDAFGCESALSTPHTTMHLKSGVSLQGQPQLWWTAYEGVDVDAYIVYRKNNDTQQFDSIGSTFLTSYTDQYPNGSASYRVAIRFARNIAPSRLKSDSGPFSQSMSNLAEAIILAVDGKDGTSISLSPNPVMDVTTLSLPSVQCFVTVTDANGRQVLPSFEASGETLIDASPLSQGAYTVTVVAGDEMLVLTLVKADGAK